MGHFGSIHRACRPRCSSGDIGDASGARSAHRTRTSSREIRRCFGEDARRHRKANDYGFPNISRQQRRQLAHSGIAFLAQQGGMAIERYALEPRGSGLFDLVHYSRDFVA